MLTKRTGKACLFVLPALLAGCAARSVPPVPAPASSPPAEAGFIDLQAGWRLSVVTPLLKSGTFRLDAQPAGSQAQLTGEGNALSVTMSAGPDFVGYERSYYLVEARGGGVRVRFAGAETVQDGKTTPRDRPAVELFRLPGNVRHVRLVYLIRASQADHNMAVIASKDLAGLQSLTRDIQSDPNRHCQSRPSLVCQWIPAGIAVRPEKEQAGSPSGWVPVR